MMCFLAQQREDPSPCSSGSAAECLATSTSAQLAAVGSASTTSTQSAADGPAATSNAQVDHDDRPTSQEGEMVGDLAATFQPELFCLSPQSPASGSPLLPFNELKSLLMTKFDKSEKTRPSDFLFQTVRFWQFQRKAKEWAKFEDLKIKVFWSKKMG
jgi:hypothetical protein